MTMVDIAEVRRPVVDTMPGADLTLMYPTSVALGTAVVRSGVTPNNPRTAGTPGAEVALLDEPHTAEDRLRLSLLNAKLALYPHGRPGRAVNVPGERLPDVTRLGDSVMAYAIYRIIGANSGVAPTN